MNFKPPTCEQEEFYLKQINYTRKQLEADVHTLRQWVDSQPHFPPSSRKESDDFLVKFLIGCKGSLEKSKRKLDNYYSFKCSNNQIYTNWDPASKEIAEAMDCIETGVLKESMEDGTRALLFNPTKNVQAKILPAIHTLGVMALELELRNKGISPMSYCMICDFKMAQLDEMAKMNPLIVRDFFFVLQEVMPIRIKHVILFNVKSALSGLINYLVKPVLPKKISDRLHVDSAGWEKVSNYVPLNILPKEGGGDSGSLRILSENLYKLLKAKRDWFVGDLAETTDETKRPPESKKREGLEGSFKTLQVD